MRRNLGRVVGGRLAAAACAAALVLCGGPALGQIGLPKPKPKEDTGPTVMVKPRPGEVRATWLRAPGSGDGDALDTPAKTGETMKRLRDMGLNAVYVTAWDQGYTTFPSEVMQKTAGVAIGPTIPGAGSGRDVLGEALSQGHRHGLLVIASFDGGLSCSPATADHALRKAKPEWLLKDAKGGTAGAGHAWINPLVPEARQFMIDLVLEAVEKYDLDGIQLSDRFFWPDPGLGYDEATRVQYAKETGGQALPADGRDQAFTRWRAGKSAQLIRDVAGAIKAKRPGLIVSVVVPTDKPTVEAGLVDWASLVRLGVGDEFVARCERADFAAFQAAWMEAMKVVGGRRAECVVSIRPVGGGLPDQPWAEVKKALEAIRESKAAGVAYSSSRALLFTHSAAVLDFYAPNLKGRERHTLRGLEWRPGPLQPERMNFKGEFMVVRGLVSGVYRAVVTSPTGVVECPVRVAEGAARLSKEAAAALQGGGTVEFLVDRKLDNALPIPDPNAPPPPPPPPPPQPRPKKSDGPKTPGGGG